jgi:hypothetical protein
MRFRTLALTASAALFAVAPLSAQYGGGRHGGGMRGGMRGGRGGMMGGRRQPPDFLRDPVILDGPPTVAALDGVVTLTDSERTRYAALYDSFMVATKPARDSVTAARSRMRSRFEGGEGAGAGEGAEASAPADSGRTDRDAFRRLGKSLEDDQKAFDVELKRLLTKEQYKAYEKWRKEERDQADAERRDAEGSRGGGRAPRM